jgi:WD40 repeat protein
MSQGCGFSRGGVAFASRRVSAMRGFSVRNACPAEIDVLSAAVTGQGRWLMLSQGGGTARCWPVDLDGPLGAPMRGQHSFLPAEALALVPGHNVVVGRSMSELWRWDCSTGEPFGTPVRHRSLLTHPKRSALVMITGPDGPLAVTDAAEGGLRQWDALTGEAAGDTVATQAGAITALAVAELPDGSVGVVSAGADRMIRLWDPLTWTEAAEPVACGRRVLMLSLVHLDGMRPVVCALRTDGSVRRHDLATGEVTGPLVRTGWQPRRPGWPFPGFMTAVAAAGRGVVATCADFRSVYLWDLLTGEPTGRVITLGARAYRMAAARLADGTPVIVIGDGDGYVRRFDAVTGAAIGAPVVPHGWPAAQVLPVPVPGGGLILAVECQGRIRRFDARTGEPVGDPGRPWHAGRGRLSAAPLPDGRVILAAAGENGIRRQDIVSGAEYPAGDDEKDGTIWDIATAALPGGPVIIAGAGHDWTVRRWDAGTGSAAGEPLAGHQLSVKAVTAARQAGGSPMFVTGCERGLVFCWDAATGTRIGDRLPGAMDDISDLAVVVLPGGRQLLIGLDTDSLYRWDLGSRETIGQPVRVGKWARIVATHLDSAMTPTAFLHIPGEDDDRVARVERWRLDTGTRLDPVFPATLRAVFDDGGVTWAVLGERDGSLQVRPLNASR